MEDLRDLVALAVPAGSRVLAVAPDPWLLESLSARSCRTWSVVADDSPTLPLKAASEDVAVCDMARLDVAEAFPGLDVDVVVMAGVLAHLTFPAAFLQRAIKALTADGRLVVSVPNATHVARRIRAWDGLAEDEEVAPGWPLRRSFTRARIEQLMRDNGLSVLETLAVRAPAVAPSGLPPAVLSFLRADEDADTDHWVIVAAPATGLDTEALPLAAELQRRLHQASDELLAREEALATLERELEALQLDVALKDDFALELRGQAQTAEGKVAALEAQLVEARASLDAAEQRLVEQERELADLRRQAGRGALGLLVDRLARRWTGRP